MSDYSKATNFTSKDTLPSGNPSKIVKGTEIDIEFTAIASAIASKADISSPALLGTPTAPTATAGSNTTQLATTAYVKAEITAQGLGNMSTQAKTAVDITGGTIVGITDLAVADGGTSSSSFTANSVVLGNGTSALNGNMVAPSTNGNVLTSNGTTWASTANTGAAKAWVNFSGVSSTTIKKSFNVSSVTYVSQGKYTVNFTTSLADANYSLALGICGLANSGGGKLLVEDSSGSGGTLGRSTSAVTVLSTYSFNNPGSVTDDNSYSNSVTVFD
jgi:hypothetical protein